jgi:hypothetical protein
VINTLEKQFERKKELFWLTVSVHVGYFCCFWTEVMQNITVDGTKLLISWQPEGERERESERERENIIWG